RFLHKDKLKTYLQTGADIFLAQGREKLGEEYARYLAQHFPHAKRLVPEQGQSWHEEWLLQREEKERPKLLFMESTRPKASQLERADESLKPAAGMWR
ncbi:MAG: hypothetical protein FWG97_05265, partial [Deltaproteobacteria bacterium]|nr:hypothetical protein [Deltaproteobacteria bacterium]